MFIKLQLLYWFQKTYYKLVPTYKRVDFKICSWEEADQLIRKNNNWVIAKEDEKLNYPLVAIEIKERIF